MTVEFVRVQHEREVDFLVAERVMGWARNPSGLWTHNATRQWSVDASHIPHYSSKIAAAFKVVERLSPTDDLGFTLVQRAYGTGQWRASFHSRRAGEGPCFGNADTAPLAICLAALEASGIIVQGVKG